MGLTNRLTAVALALVVAMIVVTGTEGQSDYCSLCSSHTLCIYEGVSSDCNKVLARGVDSTDQQTILAEHNKHRNYVASGKETRGNPGSQPSASDMLKMTWDSELATVAQRWADQCMFGHDTCRNVSRFSAVGQNTFEAWTTGTISGTNWAQAVQAWYDEVDDFDKSIVPSYVFGEKYGHYSQVVWAKSHLVGCGYIAYQKDNKNYQYNVCNYAPAGNYRRRPVYTIGTGCSACTSGCDATYTSLCA